MDYLEEAEEIQEIEEAESPRKSKLNRVLLSVIIFIILFLAVYFIFTWNSKNISSNELLEGVAVEVGENDAVKFRVDDEEHGMKIGFVGEDFVEITISSEPINLSLKLNEVKELDLNGDGKADIRVKLVRISNGKATVAVMKIRAEFCQERWNCTIWERCSYGKQTRKCTDLNSCGTIFDRPFLKKDCLEIEFIEENSYFNNSNNSNNSASINNSINRSLINVTSCPVNTYACYESQGSFCLNVHSLSAFNPICCSKACLTFGSKERFCSVNDSVYFEDNSTHICAKRITIPFNGTNIHCCKSIVSRTNVPVVKSCADQGESFSSVYVNEYPANCCVGLTAWNAGMDANVSIADECYQTILLSGNPIGKCINCSNNICEETENVCNCPTDCLGKEKSTYKTITEFCESDYGKNIISNCVKSYMVNQPICSLCQNVDLTP